MRLCDADPAGGDIFIDGGAGGLLEDTADIRFAQEEIPGQLSYRNILIDILVDIAKDGFYMLVVFVIAYIALRGVDIEEGIHHCQQFHESSLLHNVVGIAFRGGYLADIVEKTLLLCLVQGDLVPEAAFPVGKAVIQVGVRGGNPFYEIRVDAQHNPLVDAVVNLGQFMAFVLVDDKQVPGRNRIKAVINQELFSAGDGIVHFIAIMDMHVHGFFLFIKMGNGKGFGTLTILDGGFTGIDFFHGQVAPLGGQYNFFGIYHKSNVQNLQGFEKYLNRL